MSTIVFERPLIFICQTCQSLHCTASHWMTLASIFFALASFICCAWCTKISYSSPVKCKLLPIAFFQTCVWHVSIPDCQLTRAITSPRRIGGTPNQLSSFSEFFTRLSRVRNVKSVIIDIEFDVSKCDSYVLPQWSIISRHLGVESRILFSRSVFSFSLRALRSFSKLGNNKVSSVATAMLTASAHLFSRMLFPWPRTRADVVPLLLATCAAAI